MVKRKKLPLHLQRVVANLDRGRDIEGKPLPISTMRRVGRFIGAETFVSPRTGKVLKVRPRRRRKK